MARRTRPARVNRNRPLVRTQRTAMRKAVHALLVQQADAVARQLSAVILAARTKLGKADDVPIPPEVVQEILDAVTFGSWAELTPYAERILLLIAEDGGRRGLTQVGVPMTPEITDQVHAAAVEFAHERAAEMVGMKYNVYGVLVDNPDAQWAITESTRELMRGDITRALEEGWGTDELASELADSYAFSDARAMTIARTELAQADVEGNLAGWRASGEVTGKEWILSDSHDHEDECDEAEAMGVVDIDDDFGGIGDPPAHPNCECDVLPVLADEGPATD